MTEILQYPPGRGRSLAPAGDAYVIGPPFERLGRYVQGAAVTPR